MMTFESKSRRPLSTRAITAIAVTDLLTLAILELIIIIVITMTTRIKLPIIINWTWKASLLWPACWLSPQSTPCKNIWSSCKLSLMTKSCNTSMVSPWQGIDSRGGRWSWQSWLDSRSTVCVGNLSGKSCCLCTTPWSAGWWSILIIWWKYRLQMNKWKVYIVGTWWWRWLWIHCIYWETGGLLALNIWYISYGVSKK